ncbi:unnamed protein product, partial [Coccothraustes coccothraustes]
PIASSARILPLPRSTGQRHPAASVGRERGEKGARLLLGCESAAPGDGAVPGSAHSPGRAGASRRGRPTQTSSIPTPTAPGASFPRSPPAHVPGAPALPR